MPELEAACAVWLLPCGVVRFWLLGFAALLLPALTRFRYATGGALRIFSIAVAVQAVLSSIAIGVIANVTAKHQNPSTASDVAGVALAACGLVGIAGSWLGRSWTPRTCTEQEPPEEIDWRREGRHIARDTLRLLLVLLVLLVLVTCSAPIWLPVLLVLAVFDESGPFRWVPHSLELAYLVLAAFALLACVWLSTGKRGTLRAPVPPNVALWLALTCVMFALPKVFSSFFEPARELLHDDALLGLLGDAVASDSVRSFEDAKQELLRRPSDRAHTLELASRRLRRDSAGSASMSARLAALDPPPSYRGSPCVGFSFEPSHLPRFLPPELAVVDVLLARGATQEALAWLTDPEVPLVLRIRLLENWPRESPLPRPSLIAAFGKACAAAPHDLTIMVAQRSYSGACTACGRAIYSLLPPEPTAITVEQGYAAGYALVAMRERFTDDLPWSEVNDEIAVAMLRGMRAAEQSDSTRKSTATRCLSCPTFQRLAALVCPAEPVPRCSLDGSRLDVLTACHALPAATPELVRFGGY